MIDTVKVWSEISLSDLKSAQLLYDNNHFRTSYFFFQQATEKANKAFALLSGQVKENELKDILHDQFKIYRKSIVKQEREIKTLIEVLKPFPHVDNHQILSNKNFIKYHASLEDSVQFIDSLRNYDLVNISLSDLNYLIRQLQQLQKIKITLPRNYEKRLEKFMLNIIDWVGKFETTEALEGKFDLMKFINDKDQSKQLYDIIANKAITLMLDFSFIHLTLYFCALLTVQHSSLSRYPIKGINPENIYKRQLPLIKKQPQFMSFLQEAVMRLKKY